MLKPILILKQDRVYEASMKFKEFENNTDKLYLKVAELEAPVEEQLQTNMSLSRVKQSLA